MPTGFPGASYPQERSINRDAALSDAVEEMGEHGVNSMIRSSQGMDKGFALSRGEGSQKRSTEEATASLRGTKVEPVIVDSAQEMVQPETSVQEGGPRPQADNGDPWNRALQMVERYDNNVCKNWSDEIQTLLIFTSLFAATVTTFAAESYQWLDNDAEETSARLLIQISLQLANMSDPGRFDDILSNTRFSFDFVPIKPYAVGVNALWFLSLAVSLSVVLFGILCMQWLREYQTDATSIPPKDAVSLRQLRYRGLFGWKVPQIISLLPFLLQVSVILFFMGLAYLLWALNTVVAAIVMPVLVIVPLALLGTTMAPVFQVAFLTSQIREDQAQCPYKSAQAWWWFRMCRAIFGLLWKPWEHPSLLHSCLTWTELDDWWMRRWPKRDDNIYINPQHGYLAESILWMVKILSHTRDIWSLLHSVLPTLTDTELTVVVRALHPVSTQSTRLTKLASRIFDDNTGMRACSELAVLLKLPPSAWDLNGRCTQAMIDRLEDCMSDPEYMANFFEPGSLYGLLDQFQRPHSTTEAPSPQQRAQFPPKIMTLLECWAQVISPDDNDPKDIHISKSQFWDTAYMILPAIIPFPTRRSKTKSDEDHFELNLTNMNLCNRILHLVLTVGDGSHNCTSIVESLMNNMRLLTPSVLRYKYESRDSEAWRCLRGLAIDTQKAYQNITPQFRQQYDVKWLIFYGVVTDEWLLDLASNKCDTLWTTLSRLSAADLYPVATWTFKMPWNHPTGSLTIEDLGIRSIRASVELAILLRLQSRSRWLREQRKELIGRIQACIVNDPSFLDSGTFVSYGDVATFLLECYSWTQHEALPDSHRHQLAFALDFVRTFFITLGFGSTVLWGHDADVATFNNAQKTLVHIILTVVEQVGNEGNYMNSNAHAKLCIAGLSLLEHCSWIGQKRRGEIVKPYVRALSTSNRSWHKIVNVMNRKEMQHSVLIIQRMIVSNDLSEVVDEYPGWNALINSIPSGYDE